MLQKIDHIGIAVKDLKETLENYKNLFGLEPSFVETVEDQGVRTAGFSLGESTVEFLEPTAEDSPIAKFINQRGAGIHHIAYRVENLEEVLEELEKKNVKLIDKKPRMGAEGKKIAFIHPKSTGGILIELCE